VTPDTRAALAALVDQWTGCAHEELQQPHPDDVLAGTFKACADELRSVLAASPLASPATAPTRTLIVSDQRAPSAPTPPPTPAPGETTGAQCSFEATFRLPDGAASFCCRRREGHDGCHEYEIVDTNLLELTAKRVNALLASPSPAREEPPAGEREFCCGDWHAGRGYHSPRCANRPAREEGESEVPPEIRTAVGEVIRHANCPCGDCLELARNELDAAILSALRAARKGVGK
jgi:hypothetical protein